MKTNKQQAESVNIYISFELFFYACTTALLHNILTHYLIHVNANNKKARVRLGGLPTPGKPARRQAFVMLKSCWLEFGNLSFSRSLLRSIISEIESPPWPGLASPNLTWLGLVFITVNLVDRAKRNEENKSKKAANYKKRAGERDSYRILSMQRSNNTNEAYQFTLYENAISNQHTQTTRLLPERGRESWGEKSEGWRTGD